MSSTEPRDQLADLLYKEGAYCGNCDYESRCRECDKVLDGYATAIRKAGWRPPPRRIETAEELDALQPAAEIVRARDEDNNLVVPALIRGADNFVFERVTTRVDLLRHEHRSHWWQPGAPLPRRSDELAYPVTVLIEPEETGCE